MRFVAQFEDGSRFEHRYDDESTPSMRDFVRMKREKPLAFAALVSPQMVVAVDVGTGGFGVNATDVQVGGPLPAGLEWVEGDEAQPEYFRKVERSFNGTDEVACRIRHCIGTRPRAGTKNYIAIEGAS
jgi:hypothetical protein